MWQNAEALDGTPGETYFKRHRGLAAPGERLAHQHPQQDALSQATLRAEADAALSQGLGALFEPVDHDLETGRHVVGVLAKRTIVIAAARAKALAKE